MNKGSKNNIFYKNLLLFCLFTKNSIIEFLFKYEKYLRQSSKFKKMAAEIGDFNYSKEDFE